MFIVNDEKKPGAKYRIITRSVWSPNVSDGNKKALELLETEINNLGEYSNTSYNKLAITLIGSPTLTVTPAKDGVVMYDITASQAVLVEVIE